jgi:hypothetical protein
MATETETTPLERRSGFPRALAAFASVGVALACACSAPPEDAASSEDGLTAGPSAGSALFAPLTKRLSVEIDYVPGAEPFVKSAGGADPWKVFRDNANAILDGKIDVVVPAGLDGMERLSDVTAKEFDRADLVAIAQKHRGGVTTSDTVSLYILFLDGKFKDTDGSVSDNTAGVSVRGTGIIAMFKPVLTDGFKDPASPVYMEQTTLIHEFGHAIGLVDDGISPTSPHRDDAHGAHCKNPACIMYYKNDLVKDGVDFAATYLAPRHGILFGSECLADTRALSSDPGGHFASLVTHTSGAATATPATLKVDE